MQTSRVQMISGIHQSGREQIIHFKRQILSRIHPRRIQNQWHPHALNGVLDVLRFIGLNIENHEHSDALYTALPMALSAVGDDSSSQTRQAPIAPTPQPPAERGISATWADCSKTSPRVAGAKTFCGQKTSGGKNFVLPISILFQQRWLQDDRVLSWSNTKYRAGDFRWSFVNMMCFRRRHSVNKH